MGRTILNGVIRMPFHMAMADELSRRQFYAHAQMALDKLNALECPPIATPGTLDTARIAQARKALDDMDDYARMEVGVDAMGPRNVLEKFIDDVQAAHAGAHLKTGE